MMHTEPEARELYCPHRKKDGERHCVASRCMAWRWAQKPNPDWRHESAFGQWPARDMRNDPPMYIDDKACGYCGLAGRP